MSYYNGLSHGQEAFGSRSYVEDLEFRLASVMRLVAEHPEDAVPVIPLIELRQALGLE